MTTAEQEKGFVYKGRFSQSIDLNQLKKNMERRLAFEYGSSKICSAPKLISQVF